MAEGVFNLTAQTQSTAFNLNPVKTAEAKSANTPQPAAGPTPGTFNLTRQSDLKINMSAHATNCDCTGKRTTSLGSNQQSSPASTNQVRSAFNLQTNSQIQNQEASQAQIKMSAHKANCDCTGKRTTSLGSNQQSSPASTSQVRSTFNIKTVSNPTEQPGQSQKTSSEPTIRMSAHKADCDCTGKRTTSLGNTPENKTQKNQPIPQESRQKINEQRVASMTGFDASVKETQNTLALSTPASLKNVPVSQTTTHQTSGAVAFNAPPVKASAAVNNQPGIIVSVNQKTPASLSPVSIASVPILKNTPTAATLASPGQVIRVAHEAHSEISFGNNFTASKATVNAAPQVAIGSAAKFLTNEKIITLSLMQTLESKPAQATFKNGIPLSTLAKALQLKNPELIKKMLQVKANTYGFVQMDAIKTAIQNNFIRHDALKKLFELLSGQIFSTVPEIELEGALKAYAEFLKEQKQKKLLDEEKERQRKRQKQKKTNKKRIREK